jgi:hypothetical protein
MIQEEEQKLNKSRREEVVLRYKSVLLPYYWNGQENEEFEQKFQNFEPPIHYIVEQKITTQGIKMSRGVELVLVTRQEIIVLLRAKPTMA